jgi:hypothetical protein|tara:strand:- start:461 stop:1129 length:669 start_codon:yes stop_codon:yes gene_type:complete
MKLSEKTVNLLKNFASINQSILFKKGNTLRTMSVMKNILAEADIAEEIPQDFAIYDLVQFLNGISLYSDPELDFQNESYLTIRDGKNHRTKYFFADPSVIVSPPEKSLTLPGEDVSFTLDTNNLTQLLKAAAVYQLPDFSVVGGNGAVYLVVRDKKNDTSNDFSIVVGETDNKFSFNFKVENIKILPGTYQVAISEKLLSRFVNENYNLTYYIALEPDSTFG